MKSYLALAIAIISEICGTTMLKLSDGFSNVLPSIGVVIGMGVAFYSLSISLRTIPLSLAYAIWSGAGTALTALIGILVWNDPFNLLTGISLLIIIGGLVLLNSSKPSQA
ncbi:multidrug efflux SMR transporter [Paenibacillus sp. MMS20-IR301]|uniref:DMT family transporter n=1 Tax=Paenibacillus sp. MMS20-IR301 TaxID=2895946 RepID=UPI0028EA4573|nr:multidrug efflux SMR transporter [Paenibacillus sp. MMS20-IR301]WNS44668.1 multidrug efflux SMR transporter [Paenibacillus sp. MMS20-IR301]